MNAKPGVSEALAQLIPSGEKRHLRCSQKKRRRSFGGRNRDLQFD